MRDAGYGVIVGFQMEEKIEQAYLYDFYGELLNEHQRRIYEDFVFNDLSLGEIADEEGISRQGVHDMGQVYVTIAFSIFPVIVVYIFLSKYIVQGIALGAVKG